MKDPPPYLRDKSGYGAPETLQQTSFCETFCLRTVQAFGLAMQISLEWMWQIVTTEDNGDLWP